MDVFDVRGANDVEHVRGAGDVREPRFGRAVAPPEAQARGVVEDTRAVPGDPSEIGIGEPAARHRQIAGEHPGTGESFAEFDLPVAHDPLDAGLGRFPPAPPDHDGQGLAVEEEIADEVRAEEPRGAGDEQVVALHCGNVDHGWSVLRLEEPPCGPAHGGKQENVGVSQRRSQCPLANDCPARQMAATLARSPTGFLPGGPSGG